jgi:trehalose-6-phosphatase
MGLQVTDVQKSLSGFDYAGSAEDLAQHAEKQGADDELVQALRGLKKDSFDGPSAVMQALGDANALGGST